MKYLVTAEEMKAMDAYTIGKLGVPSCVLMERAALKAAEEIMRRFSVCGERGRTRRVLIVSGCGNNGGDGLAAGRILADAGYLVEFVLVGEREKCTEETKRQLAILENYGYPIGSKIEDKEYDIIVDALLGIRITRNMEGKYAETVELINRMHAFTAALDIPSGINSDDGRVCGLAVEADLTVTFAFPKRGLFLYPGAAYAGEIVCVDIGISERSFDEIQPQMYTYEEYASKLLPDRKKEGNKGTFGKILLLAGSSGMAGAALLAGRSAYRTGAGMVKIVTPEENRVIIQEGLPEALLMTYTLGGMADGSSKELFRDALRWADVVAAGPGMSTGAQAAELLRMVLEESEKPVILDADALNLLAGNKPIAASLGQPARREGRTVILTPHVAELARLLGSKTEEIKLAPLQNAVMAADRYGAIVISKDARTLVCEKDRREVFMNTAGNSGMATAGSGDVLTGIVAALLGQGMTPFQASCAGVYLHAKAGDAAAEEKGEAGIMAMDLAEKITEVK